MTPTTTTSTHGQRKPELLGQTVVVIGGSAGIGLDTARRARAEGANVILVARNPEPLGHAARELGALSSAAFDATDTDRLEQFFDDLPGPIDHVIVTAGGPHYEPLVEMDFARARRFFDEHLMANTALTGATYDIDGGRQLLPRGGVSNGRMDLDLRTRALPERDQGPQTRVFAGRDGAAKRGASTAHHTKPVRF
jgi:NAD(P)-dependent dehydrogenase (short-subunit alcohol dehydrogenase family)